MAPLREYSDWNVREAEDEERDLYKTYYLICEGENTEKFYFEKIINIRKELGIASNIRITYLEKIDEDRTASNPKKLIELAEKYIAEHEDSFDTELDKIILVFDLDIYEENHATFDDIIETAKEKDYLLAVTNPSFELFLMLHRPNSLTDIINPNEDDIINNAWVDKGQGKRKRYINDLFCNTFGIDPKSDETVGELANCLNVAIEQEKFINQDYTKSHGVLTSNIGLTMDNIIHNK